MYEIKSSRIRSQILTYHIFLVFFQKNHGFIETLQKKMLQLRKNLIVLIQMTFSPYHEPVLAVTSKCGRSPFWRKNPSSRFGKIIPFRKTTQNLNCRYACRQCSVNREMFLLLINILNHILKFFTEGFENLPSSFFFQFRKSVIED